MGSDALDKLKLICPFFYSLRDVETRKHETNYQDAAAGYEPEIRDDLHELEGTFAPDNVDLSRAAPIRGG